MAPARKNLPFGFEEGEQYISIVLKHRLRDKSASSLNKLTRTGQFRLELLQRDPEARLRAAQKPPA
jgi:hypothetical protein